MSFEKIGLKAETENGSKNEKIIFPHAESILRLFKDKYKDEPEKAEVVRGILYEFFDQEMKNTQIYNSKKFDSSFPYTFINTADLSRKIFTKYSGKEIPEISFEENAKKLEFVLGSGTMMKSGYQFTFVEEAMHQAIIALKRDLMAVQRGENPADQKIYILGLPINEFGKISPEFSVKLKADPFKAMAEIYSEFIESKMLEERKTEIKNLDVRLYGVSMGASFAAATGQKLIEDKAATQNQEKESEPIPQLFIRMDAPVGLSKSKNKSWQIPVGYAAEIIYQSFLDPKFRLADPKFMKQVKAVLNKRGIRENMSEDDLKYKKEAIQSIIGHLRKGVEFNESLKVNKVSGNFDPLLFSVRNYLEEKKRREKSPNGLGKNIAPRSEKNRREFMINMTHTPAFFRDNELKRYYEVAKTLQNLGN
jgi:hypothetical protein